MTQIVVSFDFSYRCQYQKKTAKGFGNRIVHPMYLFKRTLASRVLSLLNAVPRRWLPIDVSVIVGTWLVPRRGTPRGVPPPPPPPPNAERPFDLGLVPFHSPTKHSPEAGLRRTIGRKSIQSIYTSTRYTPICCTFKNN